MGTFNFRIEHRGAVSEKFLHAGAQDFASALLYIKNLRYARNSTKDRIDIVLDELCGTCSTKHAVLCELARENGYAEVRLVMGIFKMNARNTVKVAPVLEQHCLEYIPEAHNYLRVHGEIVDVTMPGQPLNFEDDLLDEMEIEPQDIGAFKANAHRVYLQQWLKNEQQPFSLGEIWDIREQCIELLSVS